MAYTPTPASSLLHLLLVLENSFYWPTPSPSSPWPRRTRTLGRTLAGRPVTWLVGISLDRSIDRGRGRRGDRRTESVRTAKRRTLDERAIDYRYFRWNSHLYRLAG
jgi:hypothetical protein